MPKGILTRMIVKRNADIQGELFWRYGVLLEHEKTSAIIRERYFENKITIQLEGDFKKELLAIIRKTIKEIHSDFNNLEVKEMIPCNCPDCEKSTDPHFYEFGLLRKYEINEIQKIRCNLSLKEVTVNSLINSAIVLDNNTQSSQTMTFNGNISHAFIGSEVKPSSFKMENL